MGKVGRPKIEGLERFALRLVKEQLYGIDEVVAIERVRRCDPALNRTDVIREFVAKGIEAHKKSRD